MSSLTSSTPTQWCGAKGWGPFSPDTVDFSLCFEHSILIALPACLATVLGLARIGYLRHYGKLHGLGHTWLYIPSITIELLMTALLAIQLVHEQFFSSSTPTWAHLFALGSSVCAWITAVQLNQSEVLYTIHSSDLILTFYTLCISASSIALRTLLISNGETIDIRFAQAYLLLLVAGLTFEAWPRDNTFVQIQSGAAPQEKANLFNRLVYHYIQPIVLTGYRRPLELNDSEAMLPELARARNTFTHLDAKWRTHLENRKRANKKPSLMWTIVTAFPYLTFTTMTCKILASFLTFVNPYLLDKLLAFISSYNREDPNPQPVAYGIALAVGMFLASTGVSFLTHWHYRDGNRIATEINSGLIAMIYRKAMRLSPQARQQMTTGEVTNRMSVDAQKWLNFTPLMPMAVGVPLEISIACVMLYTQLGWSALSAVAVIIIVTPFQGKAAAFLDKAGDAKLEASDNRMRLVNEILSGIKIVKLYGWTKAFAAKIQHFRDNELELMRQKGLVISVLSIVYSSLPLFMALVSFAVFSTVGGPDFTPGVLTAQRIFVSLSLFGLLNRPVGMLGIVIEFGISLRVSTRRIETYQLLEELEDSVQYSIELPKDDNKPVIEFNNATFAWANEKPVDTETASTDEEEEPTESSPLLGGATPAGSKAKVSTAPMLKNITLDFYRGNLIAVVGRVGQGKSSMLNAIIGEMYMRQGSCKVSGRIAYVAQQAWIINASVQNNILFGKPMDQERYNRVLEACGLAPDMAILAAGDQTEIGERGINLSGGQKQRVSLARAVYQDADIYLLDDPLSAVDAHVDHHLWENVIGPNGMLNQKTRILVTHGIHHLNDHVDQIVVLKDGEVSETGTYETLMSAKLSFYQLIKEYSVARKGKKGKVAGTKVELLTAEAAAEASTASSSAAPSFLESSTSSINETVAEETSTPAGTDNKGELVTEEDMHDGVVTWATYQVYFRAVSFKTCMIILLLFIAWQGLHMSVPLWLKHWVDVIETTDKPVSFFLFVYGALVALYMVVDVVLTYICLVTAGVEAARVMHVNLLERIMRLPMSFFDATPVGRISNRFAGDIAKVDESVPECLLGFVTNAFGVLSTFLILTIATPAFVFAIPPLAMMFVALQVYYLRSSNGLKRLESISLSPIFSQFNETLNGVSTVRCMGFEEQFVQENYRRTDRASSAFYTIIQVNRWLHIRLELLGSSVVFFSAMLAVLGRDTVSASIAGLALTYSLSCTSDLTWLLRDFVETQGELVCVERLHEYSILNTEAPDETGVHLPENWPSEGKIEFVNYSTRYREGLDLVLKDVSFTVQPAEKIGIVGRTGAGKSSMTLALFRIIEAADSYWAKASSQGATSALGGHSHLASTSKDIWAEYNQLEDSENGNGGCILIDGIDISTIGLDHLRQHLAIIPQDPTLFAGTVRDNLDPFKELQDSELWEALERAHLKDYVSSLAGGLEFEVSQGGENLSVGQRSLVCLARALLRKTKILILDEATSSVDVETDELIQKTIRKEFKDRTTLVIAHRIKTVLDSDKILVMEKGQVEEYDSPKVLLKNKDSLFYKLADQSGEIKDSEDHA